jgi:hypothetical protein
LGVAMVVLLPARRVNRASLSVPRGLSTRRP